MYVSSCFVLPMAFLLRLRYGRDQKKSSLLIFVDLLAIYIYSRISGRSAHRQILRLPTLLGSVLTGRRAAFYFSM
jgi:hypothetical protein